MRPTDHLKAENAENWAAATKNPFTDALADGALSRDKMAGYLQQDYLFIDGFVRLLASMIAHAPSIEDSVPAAQFLALITGPENTYFLRSFEALNIPQAGSAEPETAAFQELMARARASGRYELMLGVLVVAEWVYLDWATPFEDRAEDLSFWFGEWITLHSGPGFAGVVAYLRTQLDQVWPTLDAAAQDEVRLIFAEAVTLERAFFDASWRGFPVTS
ncbi:MAG: TenA family protein [Pseudomonadota bacterium]